MIFPEFIKPGDTIGVTATSGGIVNELKQKEISDLLHIKLSLVKYRVSKAKELLSKQLEEGRD